jgi:tRNA threonylcarbamoyl adenosine modification protein YeaZ
VDNSIYLAIDSSTDNASLAMTDNGKVIAETAWHCQQNHSVELMPHLSQLLEQAGIDIKEIGGIIVAKGPGSFNGLRVGISTAKGLAFSLGVPIVGISTLETAAYQYAETRLPICPILNAGRDEIATAIYQQKEGEWHRIIAEHISTVDDLCQEIRSKTIFCGELTPHIIERLESKLEQKAIIPPPTSRPRRAGFLAKLGLKRLQSGDCDNASTLQPIYLRRPQITKPKNRNQVATRINKPRSDTG